MKDEEIDSLFCLSETYDYCTIQQDELIKYIEATFEDKSILDSNESYAKLVLARQEFKKPENKEFFIKESVKRLNDEFKTSDYNAVKRAYKVISRNQEIISEVLAEQADFAFAKSSPNKIN